MLIREVIKADLLSLIELYTQLHDNDMPKINTSPEILWNGILADKNHHIIIGASDNKLVSSCVLAVVPNLTHNQRKFTLRIIRSP